MTFFTITTLHWRFFAIMLYYLGPWLGIFGPPPNMLSNINIAYWTMLGISLGIKLSAGKVEVHPKIVLPWGIRIYSNETFQKRPLFSEGPGEVQDRRGTLRTEFRLKKRLLSHRFLPRRQRKSIAQDWLPQFVRFTMPDVFGSNVGRVWALWYIVFKTNRASQ